MAIDLNDEIVQDFLVEAGEILETLNEQAVDLETSPDDADLLNSVFRGFHTIKGGAGFLSLDNLVTIAHKCEDLFDLLRQGERKIDADLMDVVLRVLDVLNEMFDELRTGEDPSPAPQDLIETLQRLTDGSAVQEPPQVQAEPEPESELQQQPKEAVLQTEAGAGAASAGNADSDDITEEEFEALLDQLHGAGGSPNPEVAKDSQEQAGVAANVEEKPETTTASAGSASDEITEEEFENLLDEIHGKGQHGTTADSEPKAPVSGTSDGPIDSAPEEAKVGETKDAGEQKPEEIKAGQAPKETPQPPEQKPKKPKAEAKNTESSKAPKPPAGKPKAKAAVPAAETTVRVETSTLDSIMNLVGELVLIRNRMSNLEETIGDEEMTKSAASLDMITTDLQNVVLKTRMQPIKKVFGRFPRVVRDLARSLGREVNLEMYGEDTDLDKNLVEALSDPLVHLVRNAVDHGIEPPDKRVANGKPRNGTLQLGAKQEGDHVLLIISDDGAGMDPDMLRAKAVEKGVMDEDAAARLEDRECFELIFSAGFSTKTEVSDVSGRGVGMDVVKTRISQLNGVVEIDSTLGQGTTLTIKLPLTLAIMPTLMVVLGTQIFALPLVNVKEIMDFNADETNVVDGQDVLVVRGRALPIFSLSSWLLDSVFQEESKTPGHVVIVNVGTQQVGLLVDHLIGQEEVVIKPLGSNLQGVKGLAGATITGDGRIALILDLPDLIGHYARRY